MRGGGGGGGGKWSGPITMVPVPPPPPPPTLLPLSPYSCGMEHDAKACHVSVVMRGTTVQWPLKLPLTDGWMVILLLQRIARLDICIRPAHQVIMGCWSPHIRRSWGCWTPYTPSHQVIIRCWSPYAPHIR